MVAATPRVDVLYVLARFPSPSETFIAREVRAVSEQGVAVLIYGMVGAEPVAGFPPVVSGRDFPRRAVLAALLAALRRRPARLAAALAGLVPGAARRPVYLLRSLRHALRALPLADEIERRGVRRIHGHFADLPAEVALFLGRLTGRQASFSAHARDVFVAPTRLREKCDGAAAVFACSRTAAAALPPGVHVVHHGLDLQDPLWEEVFRTRAPADGCGRGPLRLLAVGRLVPKKGLHVLVQALFELRRRGVDCRCRLIGEGPERGPLAAAVRSAGLQDHVEMRGFRRWPDLAADFRWADLLVHPAIVAPDGDRDGIPNVVLEAMACGLPVVASDQPALREVVEPGVTGWLAPPRDPVGLADALAHAWHDGGRSVVVSARAAVTERFDVRKNAACMIRYWFNG